MKTKIKLKLIKIFTVAFCVALVFHLASPQFLTDNSTAYAVGDLTIDWGVPTGDPIFVVTNMMPGDMESRDVDVTNNAATARPIAVRGVPTSDPDSLSTVIDFAIFEGVTPLYGDGSGTGPKTLADFFAQSSPINGIPLSTLAPSTTTIYTFKATFDETAGNEFQNTSVVFDLIIGIGFDVPNECDVISFSGNPIFGTDGDDNIKGTNKNDLIITFEGEDKVNGSNGDDCIIGGAGDDNLSGSNGKDIIFGNEGDDKLDGSNGDDKMFGEEGNDTLNGSNGNDLMIGGEGNDIFDGSNGNDHIEGNGGDDTMVGKNGNDTLLGGPDTDSANGNLGTDSCDAEAKISCEL